MVEKNERGRRSMIDQINASAYLLRNLVYK